MRYISVQYCGNYEDIAKELMGDSSSRKLTEKEIYYTILQHCMNNPANYLKYKNIVEDILEDQGFPNIRMLNEQREQAC